MAIIPARSGSKRLPKKNILPLAGKPLIAWTIEAAKLSRYVDDVVVSTDSDEIMSLAIEYGAEAPFTRPAHLATDEAGSSPVLLDAIGWLKARGRAYDLVIMLQPTSPLRTASDIDKAVEYFIEKSAKGVISVCECEHSPLWANTLAPDHSMEGFIPQQARGLRSQDLPTYYRLNGAVYIFDVKFLEQEQGMFYSPDVYAWVMAREHSVDIDNMMDFKLAEVLINERT